MIEKECPSGRTVNLRKMKLKDENILLDQELAKNGKNIDKLLHTITGLSYEELSLSLLGDRVFLLIEIRRISKGDFYYPRVTCPICSTRFDKEINLKELKIKKLNKELLNDNHEFEITLPVSKVKLIGVLLKGVDEATIRKIRKDHPSDIMTYLMMVRVKSIEGQKLKNIKWFEDLDIEDSDYFSDEYEKHDCGVETTVDCECPNEFCGNVFDLDIPFDANFFLRNTRRKKT